MNEYDLNKIFRKKFLSKGLKSLLKQLNKEDLEISMTLMNGYQNDMTKDEIIEFLIEQFDFLIEDALKTFHSEIIDMINKMIDNHGEIEVKDIDPSFVIILKMYLVAFPVIKDNKNKLIMSNETLYFFKQLDKTQMIQQMELNDLVIRYVRGLLSSFGAFELKLLFDYINEYEHIQLDSEDYFLLLNNDSLIYGYDFKSEIIYSYQIDNIQDFHQTREHYQSLDYYHLTKNEILNGFDLTDLEIDILDFYENELDMPKALAHQGLLIIKDAIQIEMSLAELKNMLKQLYINAYQLKQLEKLIEQLTSNTRLWSLKGHTKNQVNIPKMLKFPK